MKFISKNYGWLIVTVLAILPMFLIFNIILVDFSDGLSINLVEMKEVEENSSLEMLYHISGEFAIRWMTAVLTCTPFFILFGISNLFVRQAMGIATAVWSFLHFGIFILAEGIWETFTQVNFVLGFVAVLILIPLFVTSSRKAMKKLKSTWKQIQRFSYFAIVLSILHVAILNKTWTIYAIIVVIGFVLRIDPIKKKVIAFRTNKLKI